MAAALVERPMSGQPTCFSFSRSAEPSAWRSSLSGCASYPASRTTWGGGQCCGQRGVGWAACRAGADPSPQLLESQGQCSGQQLEEPQRQPAAAVLLDCLGSACLDELAGAHVLGIVPHLQADGSQGAQSSLETCLQPGCCTITLQHSSALAGRGRHRCIGLAFQLSTATFPTSTPTSALLVSSDTLASSTPCVLRSAASTAEEQEAQTMPTTDSSRVAASPLPREEQLKPQSWMADASWACAMGRGGSRVGTDAAAPS